MNELKGRNKFIYEFGDFEIIRSKKVEAKKSLSESFLSSVENYISKSKVYIKEGDKVPEGVSIKTGPKDGKYYETSKQSNPLTRTVEREFLPTVATQEEARNLFDDKIKNYLVNLGREDKGSPARNHAADELRGAFYNLIKFEKSVLFTEQNEAMKFFNNWKLGGSDSLVEESVFAVNALMDDGLNYDDAIEEFCNSKVIKNTREYLHSDNFKETFNKKRVYIKEMQRMMSKFAPNKKIEIYRGCNGDSFKGLEVTEGDEILLDEKVSVSRWSADLGVAKYFAKDRKEHNDSKGINSKVCVLKTEVDLKDVYFFDGLMNTSCNIEGEIVINHVTNHKNAKVKVERVY